MRDDTETAMQDADKKCMESVDCPWCHFYIGLCGACRMNPECSVANPGAKLSRFERSFQLSLFALCSHGSVCAKLK